MKLNYFVWMLLAMQWIFSVITTGHVPGPSCCTKTSTSQVRVIEIAEYVHQDTPLCRIKAVRFLLRNNKEICSNPEDPWAKHVIKMLDQRTTPSLTSTSGTETITTRSSPRPSKDSTITMTTPKGSSTTWKLTTFISHGSSPKQMPGNTNKPSQTTPTQITPIKMTTSTATTTITTEGTPSTTNIETTSTSMTTESPVTMTATTLRPRTTVTHRYSTEQSTKAQITTFIVTTTTKPLTHNIKAMSKTMTTESQMTTSMSTRTATTWKPTSNTFKQVTPKTKTSSMTAGISMTTTAPRGTSTTESPVQKSSTRNSKPEATNCEPATSNTAAEKKKIPWTVRRLRKKTKKGLRKAQMNLKTC